MSVLLVALPPLLCVGHVVLELPPPSEHCVLLKFLLPSPGLPLPSVLHAMFVLPLLPLSECCVPLNLLLPPSGLPLPSVPHAMSVLPLP